MLIVTAVVALMVTSGVWNCPNGGCATGTPLTFTIETLGVLEVVGSGGASNGRLIWMPSGA